MADRRKQREAARAKMREVRTGKVRASDQYTVKQEADLIQNVTEEEYQKTVYENRKQNFIVDDLGLGYDDQGEYDWQEDSIEEKPKKPSIENSIIGFMKPSKPTPKKKQPVQNHDEVFQQYMKMMDDTTITPEDIIKQTTPKQTLQFSKGTKLSERANMIQQANRRKYNQPPPQPPKKEIVIEESSCEKKQIDSDPTAISTSKQDTRQGVPDCDEKYDLNRQIEIHEEEFVRQDFSEVQLEDSKMEEDVGNAEKLQIEVEEFQEIQETVPIDTSNMNLPLDENGELLVYWIDLFEDKEISPKSVFIFGKFFCPQTQRFESVCIIVENIQRTLYVLPKPEYQNALGEVHKEMENIRKNAGIRKWTCKATERKYAFEIPEIPPKATYLKIQYSSEYPEIKKVQGANTFSHIFGKETTLAELLMLKVRMRGPCWLLIKNSSFSTSKRSHCRLEIVVDDPSNIRFDVDKDNIPPPKLSMLSISVQTVRNNKKINELYSISGVLQESVDLVTSSSNQNFVSSFSVSRTGDPTVKSLTKVKLMPTEKALINSFLAKMIQIDPDIICGHDLFGNSLPIIYGRIQDLKIQNWSRLGRVLRQNMSFKNYSHNFFRNYTAGRLLCDTFLLTQELVREPTYTLQHLTKHLLKKDREELDFEETEALFDTAEGIAKVCKLSEMDAFFSYEIVMQLSIIPLTKQLTNIAGNIWARSLENARAERNEMLLVHEFTKEKYICPDREIKVFTDKKKNKNKYAGGLVLEPRVGLYDNIVLLLDFNSLYPSIIQEYNLCFSTVSRDKGNDESNEPGQIPDESTKPGILPRIIKSLVMQRRSIKHEMGKATNESDKKRLDIKQQAFKLTANSMYGCLGFRSSRFYARAIASLITMLGRQSLEVAVKIAKDKMLDVIYGDTDSVMIHTSAVDIGKAREMGNALKREINKKYKCLEIEIDGIFKSMLLLKKKKYAVLRFINDTDTIKEIKGLDMVRRDWCDLSKKTSDGILDILLSGKSLDEISETIKDYLSDVKHKLDNNEFVTNDFIINKQLTKPPEKYSDKKSQPHVHVALRMIQQGSGNLVKHFIPYIICKGTGSFAERARHPDDVVNSSGTIEVDMEWYISQQLFPPIRRLCDPIDSLSSGEIAVCFGLDPNKYHDHVEYNTSSFSKEYANVEELYLDCNDCKENVQVTNMSTSKFNRRCSQNHLMSEKRVLNGVMLFVKAKGSMMQNAVWTCEDSTCGKESRLMNPKCYVCKSKMVSTYSITTFHNQLTYLKEIFSKNIKENSLESAVKYLTDILKSSVYQQVDLVPFRASARRYDHFF